jgi:stearoyl-CoA desaturase (Delta-9 desaturase)
MAPEPSDPVLTGNGVTHRQIHPANATQQNGTKTSQNASIEQNDDNNNFKVNEVEDNVDFRPQIRWPDLIAQVFIHAGFVYGLYFILMLQAKFYTYIWSE